VIDVETEGEPTTGATIFDRRNVRQWRLNTDLVISMDAAAVKDVILRGLARIGEAG
jgi:hypothetical protein